MTPKTPILVVGGFLGSGKTTLVRRLLAEAQREGVKLAVISNEFGELGIDAALLGAGQGAMVELSGGCVCCSLSNELIATLEMLRTTAHPDRIVIETSGLALPFESQLHLYRPPVRDWVGDEACVVVVDAERVHEPDPLFAEQVQSADLLILSKCDLVEEADRLVAERRLAELSPGTPVIRSIHGDVSLALLFPSGPRKEAPKGHHHDHDHASHGHHAHEEWESFEVHPPEALGEDALLDWLHTQRGVRTKGFVRLEGKVRIVQGVGRRMELTEPIDVIDPALVGRVVVIRRRT